MRIDVTYSSGLVESYRTEGESGVTANALAGAPDRGRGETSAAVLLRLRLDRLEQDGLRVDIYWYGTAVDDLTRTTATGDFGVDEVPELCLELGRVWRILGPDDMAGVRSVDVDGRRRLARIAGELVCLDLLDDRERYWVGSSGGEALVERVARIHGAIREANPSWDDERVAAEYGFPLGAYASPFLSEHCVKTLATASARHCTCFLSSSKWRRRGKCKVLACLYSTTLLIHSTTRTSMHSLSTCESLQTFRTFASSSLRITTTSFAR
jgi:hypothetical protein